MKNKERIISAAFITLVIVGLCKWCYDDVNKVETPDVAVTEVTTTNITTETTTGVTTSCTTSCTTTLNTTVETTEISAEPTTELVTESPVTEIPTTEVIIEEPKNEPVIEVPVAEEPAPVEEYLVYKESTHYIHRNTCRWNKDDAYRVDDVTGLEARLCTECNPQCEGYTEYIPPEPEVPAISDYDYTLLCKIVACEYGGMADVYERAKIVASVMNQSKYTGDSIETCLYRSCVPWGFCPWNDYFCGGTIYYGDMSDAVDYYFNNPGEFQYWDCDSWWGDGYYNHFYKA